MEEIQRSAGLGPGSGQALAPERLREQIATMGLTPADPDFAVVIRFALRGCAESLAQAVSPLAAIGSLNALANQYLDQDLRERHGDARGG